MPLWIRAPCRRLSAAACGRLRRGDRTDASSTAVDDDGNPFYDCDHLRADRGAVAANIRVRRACRPLGRRHSQPRTPWWIPGTRFPPAPRRGRAPTTSWLRWRRSGQAPGWCRSAPARSSSPLPACLTADGPPLIGSSPTTCAGCIRRCSSTKTCLFVDDGDVLTSAGLAPESNVCLHIIRKDHGTQVANAVSPRYCVVPAMAGGLPAPPTVHRSPGAAADHYSTAPTREWALRHLDEELTGAADGPAREHERAHLQPRFREETGESPGRGSAAGAWTERVNSLESRDMPIDEVARLSGLGTGGNLRHHLRRGMGMSPSSYRKVYQGA